MAAIAPAVYVPAMYPGPKVGNGEKRAADRIGAAAVVCARVLTHLASRYKMPLQPGTTKTACKLFEQVYASERVANYSIEHTLESVMSIACKMYGEPWSPDDILLAMGRKNWSADRTVARLVYHACGSPPFKDKMWEAQIRRCCVGARIDDAGVVTASMTIYERMMALRIGSKRGAGAGAAACVYMACQLAPGYVRSIRDVAKAVGAKMSTVVGWYHKLWAQRSAVVPLRIGNAWQTTLTEVECLAYRVHKGN